jgi:hypothetical protein
MENLFSLFEKSLLKSFKEIKKAEGFAGLIKDQITSLALTEYDGIKIKRNGELYSLQSAYCSLYPDYGDSISLKEIDLTMVYVIDSEKNEDQEEIVDRLLESVNNGNGRIFIDEEKYGKLWVTEEYVLGIEECLKGAIHLSIEDKV